MAKAAERHHFRTFLEAEEVALERRQQDSNRKRAEKETEEVALERR